MELTHLDGEGQAFMVDVGGKDMTERMAVAEARVKMKPETLEMILAGNMKKGDVFASARIAGIMGRQAHARPDPIVPSHPAHQCRRGDQPPAPGHGQKLLPR